MQSLYGYTMSTPVDCTYRWEAVSKDGPNITPRDEGAAVYMWRGHRSPKFVGTVIRGAIRRSGDWLRDAASAAAYDVYQASLDAAWQPARDALIGLGD